MQLAGCCVLVVTIDGKDLKKTCRTAHEAPHAVSFGGKTSGLYLFLFIYLFIRANPFFILFSGV